MLRTYVVLCYSVKSVNLVETDNPNSIKFFRRNPFCTPAKTACCLMNINYPPSCSIAGKTPISMNQLVGYNNVKVI